MRFCGCRRGARATPRRFRLEVGGIGLPRTVVGDRVVVGRRRGGLRTDLLGRRDGGLLGRRGGGFVERTFGGLGGGLLDGRLGRGLGVPFLAFASPEHQPTSARAAVASPSALAPFASDAASVSSPMRTAVCRSAIACASSSRRLITRLTESSPTVTP